jgi:hypothetical protein
MGSMIGLQTRPLCRRYSLLAIQNAPLRIASRTDECLSSLHWAVGFLSDGEWEVLGLWRSRTWPEILTELERRGIEEIGLLLVPTAEPFPNLSPTAVSSVETLGAVCPVRDDEITQVRFLDNRLRQFVNEVRPDMDHLRLAIERAIARHRRLVGDAGIVNAAAAAAFRVEAELNKVGLRMADGTATRASRRMAPIGEAVVS